MKRLFFIGSITAILLLVVMTTNPTSAQKPATGVQKKIPPDLALVFCCLERPSDINESLPEMIEPDDFYEPDFYEDQKSCAAKNGDGCLQYGGEYVSKCKEHYIFWAFKIQDSPAQAYLLNQEEPPEKLNLKQIAELPSGKPILRCLNVDTAIARGWWEEH
jgi:hypothetical protein